MRLEPIVLDILHFLTRIFIFLFDHTVLAGGPEHHPRFLPHLLSKLLNGAVLNAGRHAMLNTCRVLAFLRPRRAQNT
jgi:hypothetical protein